MSITLRLGLVIGAAVIFALVCVQVSRRRIRVSDSVFWVVFSAILLLIAIVPQIAFGLAQLMGIVSPSNLVFAVMLGILIVIDIQSSSKISMLTDRLQDLASRVALMEDERRARSRPQDGR